MPRTHETRCVLAVALACGLLPFSCRKEAGAVPNAPEVAWYTLQSPRGREIEQASDLCFGRIGDRGDLWTVCDRNGGESAARVYRFDLASLSAARTGEAIRAAEEFVVAPPAGGWARFRQQHAMLGPGVLQHIEERVDTATRGAEGPRLDLEAVAIGPAIGDPNRSHLFVVAEEPYSLVLELALDPRDTAGRAAVATPGGPEPSKALLVAAYRYAEREQEHGTDLNDGLEALAYAGTPGRFWWGEEGTRLHKPDAHPRLFFAGARLGVAELAAGAVAVDGPVSEAATRSFQARQAGDAQTLNALAAMPDGSLAAVDRNGAWVLRIDPKSLTVSRWFNLYDFGGRDLRKLLADFPGPRRMPYVSIEGIAVEPDGTVWLVDDPAMPEAFRASCLVRIDGLPPPKPGG